MAQETSVMSPGPSSAWHCCLALVVVVVVVIRPWCTHHPPNEQLLVGIVLVLVSALASSFGHHGGALVLVPPCCGILFGGVEHVSVMWCTYKDCCVLTGWVSPFWGLPASLCTFLACLDSLTSRLNREEGVWVSMVVHCMFVMAGSNYH